MIQYQEKLPKEDQRFLLGYCREKVQNAHAKGDMNNAIFGRICLWIF